MAPSMGNGVCGLWCSGDVCEECVREVEIEVDLEMAMKKGKRRGYRRRKKEGIVKGDERGERGMEDGEGGRDWRVCIWEEILRKREEGEGEDGWLRDGEGEVCEKEGAVGREEKWVAGICVDSAGGGENGAR
ncbi:uncharacterized protein MONOS_3174 [Monocercomonoides exilis]|uniref:uncharacterized protein n=1 Tax=Monocercomonoides exilis TaxID=2049356 RepID=UPI00355A1797|nr:hypothetical protein MONOS_3174 [Monocercomonoides exilis]|eukprot:MONOS_3174.1-p1 / transcript=MONOS_3174.1 / gene=MONOS_3174 / organism=Monocercomonoides_exilis_PA203 / gene_product=unspecified product / transcript_product=unspecified product / location=Mono_scaffold00072:106301-106839(+) / protein_length=132 / sequence_SO=supercontig / SO=protein_coding / is_pseudo=false